MIIEKQVLDNFRNFLYEQEKSPNTIEKYQRDVKAFAEFSRNKQFGKSDLLEYKKKLCLKYAPKSVNSIISSLNAFFVFLNRNDLKIKTLRIQKRIFANKSKELTKTEYKRLLAAAENAKKHKLYCIIQTIGCTGVRISELKYITVEAVGCGQATINCKGKIRQLFLPDKLCRMLKKYIKSVNIKTGSVFVSRNGNPLDRSNIWKMLKNLCGAANVAKEKVFPHNFRHLFARTFYSLQKDIVRLADILGHSSINTTRIYTLESGEAHKKQMQLLGLMLC